MLYKEMSIHDFEPWSGAADTYKRLESNNKLNDLEWSLSEIFGRDDIEETELNDLLWFEPDTVYEMVGLKTESDIEEEIEEIESEIEEVKKNIDILENTIQEYEQEYEQKYDGQYDPMNILVGHRSVLSNLHNTLNELYDELDRLREELEEF